MKTSNNDNAMGRFARWMLGAVLAAALSLTMAEGASALGQITFGGCVSGDGLGGTCADVDGNPIDGPQGAAVSPDGNHVYVAGQSANAIAVFGRAPQGQLTYAGCASNDGSAGKCADVPGNAMVAPDDVVVSPDGGSVYAANFSSGTIVAFDRREGGEIVYDGCFGNDSVNGICTDVPGTPLDAITSLTVSPDGGTVYATGSGDVAVFGRDAGGNLAYAGCVSDNGTGGLCADVPGAPLGSTQEAAVSGDGKSLYVASVPGTVSVFDRDANGAITFGGCVSDDSANTGCANPPGNPLSGADDVEVSPDGNQVYVTGLSSQAVSVLGRASGGQVTYEGCVSDDGSGGLCGDLPDGVLLQPDALAVSGDGGSVYVSTSFSNAVVVLDRATGGQLTFGGCVSDDGTGGKCADVPGSTMQGVSDVAVSPDDGSLYVTEFGKDAVGHFFRKTRPETTIESGPAEGDAVAQANPQFTFSSDQEGATFECSIDGGQFAACASGAPITRVADGAHTLAVRAVSGGDADASPAERRFSVDTTGPSARFSKAPKRKVRTAKRKAKVRFAFTAAEAGATFECSADGDAFRACSSPTRVKLRLGKHRFSVRAVDALGNAGPAATTKVRVIGKG